jgi:hypothetical protein
MTTATTIKERPILFSGPMVQAILTGRKTQTRRIIKSPYEFLVEDDGCGGPVWPFYPCYVTGEPECEKIPCPYGKPGERLWVRETWADGSYRDPDWACCVAYRADNSGMNYLCKEGDEPVCLDTPCKLRPEGVSRWRPSIFMPRWASRITLEVTDVRAERLQDISDVDAINEGVLMLGDDWLYGAFPDYADKLRATISGTKPPLGPSPRMRYAKLWEQINGPDSWSANPWVWAVEFTRA